MIRSLLLGQVTVLAVAIVATVAACTSESGGPGPSVAAATSSPSSAASGSVWPVPAELVDRVIELAATESGVDPTTIVVVSAELVTWNSGALGCPKVGVMYTQALVEGYKVVVSAGGRDLDYRWGRSGSPRLCENPGPAGGSGG